MFVQCLLCVFEFHSHFIYVCTMLRNFKQVWVWSGGVLPVSDRGGAGIAGAVARGDRLETQTAPV